MAKKTNSLSTPPPAEPPKPSRMPLIVLALGSIAIAVLVGWALTRTVEPAVPPAATLPAAPITAPGTATDVVSTATAGAASTTAATENGGVPRIPPDQLKDMIDRRAVTIVDVRDSVSYNNGHIPGAIHIPFSRVQSEASRLPKGQPIVAYCT